MTVTCTITHTRMIAYMQDTSRLLPLDSPAFNQFLNLLEIDKD